MQCWWAQFRLPDYNSWLIEMNLWETDLSLLRRLAIYLDYHRTKLVVVLFRRYVNHSQEVMCSDVPSKVTGILAPYCALQATSNTTNIFAKATSQWVTAYFASTLATNLLGSGKCSSA
jgi:hypothetical protein